MTAVAAYLTSSIGKKQVMAITGLGLSAFTLVHMAGNFLFFLGPEAYNKYSYALTSNPLIYFAEAGLVAMFLVHMFCAFKLTVENRSARPQQYYVPPSGDKGGISLSSRFMILSGLLIFVFVVLHLITFKFGTWYSINHGGIEMRDLHRLMVETFQSPAYVALYVVALFVFGSHLSHGIASAIQTFGLVAPGREDFFKSVGCGLAVLIAAGFSTVPLYILIFMRASY